MWKSSLSVPGTSHFTILITQMGGLGDLVLTAGLLSSLRHNFADATLVLVCRAAFASVCGLFPDPPDRVAALDFSPYDWAISSSDLFAVLATVTEPLKGVRADLFIAAEYQPTWFTWFLAAQMKPQRAIQASHAKRPGNVLTGVLDHFDLDRLEFEGPKLPADLHEVQRYAEIIRFLGGSSRSNDPWIFPEAIDPQVQETLRLLDLHKGGYLVCFPLGAAGIPVKRWPKDNYLRTLEAARQKSPIPVLFTGDESETEELESFARELGGAAGVYTGPGVSIPILAGLILHSRAYLGNDTGPMHLASAYGVGGVAIYGGGHWPVYGPWGPGSVAVVHPLPCFGCNWDCLFGHGLCVESIRVEPVVEALTQVLDGNADEPRTVVLNEQSPQVLDLIRDANHRYREAELDRGERLSSIIELRRNVDSSHGRLEKLEETATDRLRALEAQHAAIEQLRRESERRREGLDELTALLDLRDARIEELEKISQERVAALKSQAASYEELRKEADLRNAGLLELTEHIATRDRRIRDLEQVALERFKALQTQGVAYEELRLEAERRRSGLVELTAHIASRDETIQKLSRVVEELSQAVEDGKAAYRELEREAEKRTAGLEALTAHIAVRDSQIRQWQQAAEERLQALQDADSAMRALSEEAEKRTSGLLEFRSIVQARDKRIAELELLLEERVALLQATEQAVAEHRRISEERLTALLTTDAALRAVREDSELRLRGLESLTGTVAARDVQVEDLNRTAAERLHALQTTDAALQAAQTHIRELLERIQQLEKQGAEFSDKIVALNEESLYNSLIRRAQRLVPKRTPHS